MAMEEAEQHEEQPVVEVLSVLLDEQAEGVQKYAVYLEGEREGGKEGKRMGGRGGEGRGGEGREGGMYFDKP